MSILAQNLKLIRKELKCAQLAMAQILKVGFRTYVRYEGGERDAPASTLVIIARLGNISLEQLLTTEVNRLDITPAPAHIKNPGPPEVQRCDFQSGQITFKSPPVKGFVSIDPSEKKLLSIFRKMDPATQGKCLKNVDGILKTSKTTSKTSRTQLKKGAGTRKRTAGLLVKSAKIKNVKVKKRGRPGRKKLDKKLLKEKINKLRMITQSINKITVK